VDRIGNRLCIPFFTACEKGLFFFTAYKEIFTGIKLIFLFRCQVGKADFSCLPSFDFLMCIDTFVFQCTFTKTVKCAAYLPFSPFRLIHDIHLLSQPRNRAEFPLSQTLNNGQMKTAKEKRIFLKKSFCRRKKSRLHKAAGIGHEKIAI